MSSNTPKIPSARVAVKTPRPDSVVEVRVTPPENNFEVKVTPGGDVIELRIQPGASLIEVRIGPAQETEAPLALPETADYQLPEAAKSVLEAEAEPESEVGDSLDDYLAQNDTDATAEEEDGESTDPLDEYLEQNEPGDAAEDEGADPLDEYLSQNEADDEDEPDPLDQYLCHNGEEEEPCDSENLDNLAEDIAALTAGAALASMTGLPDPSAPAPVAEEDVLEVESELVEEPEEEAALEDEAEEESAEEEALAEEEDLIAPDFPEDDDFDAAPDNIGPSAREALARLSAAVQEESFIAAPSSPSLPEESTAVMVESYDYDPEEEAPLESEGGPEEALPEDEQLELGLVDDEELNVGPIDVAGLKVDLESSRLPDDSSKPMIRAKPMVKA